MDMLILAKTAPIFNISFGDMIVTMCNTGILLFFYWKFLHSKVLAMLAQRRDAVNAELDAASAAKEKAAAAEAEYKALLADSKAEAGRIISSATAKAREREEEIASAAKEAALQIRQKAEEDIERQRKRALNEIKDQIAEIVIMAAGAVAEKEISESDNAKLIENFLVSAGEGL